MFEFNYSFALSFEGMSGFTIKFHRSLIRLAKGMISAWEEWLQAEIESKSS